MYGYLLLILASFALALSLTAITERKLVSVLVGRAAQPIYEEGPSWHMKKRGTPTMGGIAFLVAAIPTMLLFSGTLLISGNTDEGISLILAAGFALFNSLVGVLDDVLKLKRRKNGGLLPREKLLLQFLIAVVYLFIRRYAQSADSLYLMLDSLGIGVLYIPIAATLAVGIINFANLTDGIDGLAASVAFSIGLSLLTLSAGQSLSAAISGAVTVGVSLGFLFFNIHPAKIFMGDTGSLMLGALTVSGVFSLGEPLLILPLGAVYLLEGASVILQVLFFKLKRKRLFLMAPIHHHLEKLGISENTICIYAIILTLLCSLPYIIIRIL